MLILMEFYLFVVNRFDKHIYEINFLLLLIFNFQLQKINQYQIEIVHIH
jgi:hypothetical protein